MFCGGCRDFLAYLAERFRCIVHAFARQGLRIIRRCARIAGRTCHICHIGTGLGLAAGGPPVIRRLVAAGTPSARRRPLPAGRRQLFVHAGPASQFRALAEARRHRPTMLSHLEYDVGCVDRKEGIPVFHTNRGGDVTYHGPGQLVGYPILNLKENNLNVHQYVWDLEEIVMRTLADFGIEGQRVSGRRGVWVGEE